MLCSCRDPEPQWQKIDNQASKDAENLSDDACLAYLQFYPLDYQNKKKCVHSLNNQYIKAEYKTNLQYQRSFQYRAEKLGFLQFLKGHSLPCSGIDYGPQFIKNADGYRVNCTCGNSYLVQFDYENKKWHLKK